MSQIYFTIHIKRCRLWWVGLSIFTSEGLGGRLQWRAISPEMNEYSSGARGLRDSGDIASASLNVCSSSFGSGEDNIGGSVTCGEDMLHLEVNLNFLVH